MPALVLDVGHHIVEPDATGQRFSIEVRSTNLLHDPQVNSFTLKAQIGDSGFGPVFSAVDFSGGMWEALPHAENGGPVPGDAQLASGQSTFTHHLEALANGTVVNLEVDSTGVPYGSFELRLAGTRIGSSEFRDGGGALVPLVIINGTLQVRSIWQNPEHVGDVNDDGYVSPLDLLIIINYLNKHGPGPLPMPSPGNQPPPYLDVDGNGDRSPLDALVLINCLNNPAQCISAPAPIVAVGKPKEEEDPPEEPDADPVGIETPPPDDEKPPEPDFSLPPPPEDTEDFDPEALFPPTPFLPDQLASRIERDLVAEAIVEDLMDLGVMSWGLFANSGSDPLAAI